jgi:hypothetical protein
VVRLLTRFSSLSTALAILLLTTGCGWDAFTPVPTTGDGGAGGGGGGGGNGGNATGGDGGGAPLIECGAIDLINDNFDDDMIAPIWTQFADGGGSVIESLGALNLAVGANTASDADYQSIYYYKLQNRSASVQIVDLPDLVNACQDFQLLHSSGNAVLTRYVAGQIEFHKVVEGTSTLLAALPYDPLTHAYWRISSTDETVLWETSGDGIGWTTQTQASKSALFELDYMRVRLELDNHSATADNGAYDDFVTEGTSTGTWCPLDYLADNFDDDIRDGRWKRTGGHPEAHSREYQGQLVITLPPNVAGAAYHYVPSQPHDMTNRTAQVRLVQPANTPSTTQLRLNVEADWAMFELIDGTLFARYSNAGTVVELQDISYSANSHQYMRLVHNAPGDQLTWELSGDGENWTQFALVSPVPFEMVAVEVRLGGLTQEVNPDPGELIFDDFVVISTL